MLGWLLVDVIDLRAVFLGLLLFAARDSRGVVTRIGLRVGRRDHFLDGKQFFNGQIRRNDALEFAEDQVNGIDLFFDVELCRQIGNFTRGLEVNACKHVDVFASEVESSLLQRIAALFADGNRYDFLAVVG